MKLMLDLDGCGYQYTEAFAQVMAEKRGMKREDFPMPTEWSFYKHEPWNMTTPEFLNAMGEAIIYHNLFGRVDEPYEDFEWAVDELAYTGHELFIVTTRTYGFDTVLPAKRQTYRWLESHNLLDFFDPEHIIILGGDTPKSEVCRNLSLDVAIDDGPHNYEDLMNHGTLCMLFDRPWNQEVDTGNRVSGWIEFVQTVQSMP